MENDNTLVRRILVPATAISLALSLVATPVLADPVGPGRPWRDDAPHGATHADARHAPARADARHAAPARKHVEPAGWRDDDHDRGKHGRDFDRDYHHPIVRGHTVYVPARRVRHYRDVVVVRPYGHWYGGYGFFVRDSDAYKWLALTAITVAIINNLNEHQQRAYEQAQIQATSAPVGQTITWNDAGASGAVTTVRDGTASDGRYCREFQQTVTIAGKSEQAYGTACQQPDGAWQVVSSGQ